VSLSDLERLKLLRPESEWSRGIERSRVLLLPSVVTAAAGVAGCVLMALGGGRMLTWIGLLAFSLGLFGFVWANLKGVWQGDS
jgi:hypothetical protein